MMLSDPSLLIGVGRRIQDEKAGRSDKLCPSDVRLAILLSRLETTEIFAQNEVIPNFFTWARRNRS